MAVTAAPHGKEPGRVDTKRGRYCRQLAGQRTGCENEFVLLVYSKGTTISFSRTMFSRLRAAVSMARGSLTSWFTSTRKASLLLRRVSTSFRIREYCCEARFIRARVRIVTVTQTANVARMIMPKMTHAGIIPPRRRTSACVPIMSSETARA